MIAPAYPAQKTVIRLSLTLLFPKTEASKSNISLHMKDLTHIISRIKFIAVKITSPKIVKLYLWLFRLLF